MYFKKSPGNIVTRPVYYNQLLKNSYPPKVDTNRNTLILPSSRQILSISSHPNNLKSSARIADPLAPFSLSYKMISNYLGKNGLDKNSYLVHLGYIEDGGILVVDPVTMKSVNKNYEPFLNISGLDAKRYEKIMEKRKLRKEWYLKQGFSEEEIEKIKIIEDMNAERKAARENRKIIRKNLFNFLKPFHEKHEKNLRVFVLESTNSFEYKAVYSSLKKLNALECLRHKDFESGENYSSLESLKRQIEHIIYQQLKIEENVKLREYFKKIDINFNYPPEFDFESNSYTLFEKEFLKNERSNPFGRIVTDRERYKQFLEEYKIFLKNFGLDEDEIGKRIENLPSYEPIENLVLKQYERIGELKPFTEEIKRFDGEKNILNFFSASQFSAPCTLTRIYQALDVKIRKMEEEEKVFLGSKYHELISSDPKERAYVNHEIWKIAGLKSLPRSWYTEKYMSGEIELDGRKIHITGLADAVLICDDEIVLFEYKHSQVLPEIYKRSHGKQLLTYKKILESLGYRVADVGILLYGIAPPSKPELKPSVTNRYVIFSSSLKEEFWEDLRDYFYWIREIYHSPEKIKKLYEKEIDRGCKICCKDSQAELKERAAIKTMKEIKQRLHS